MGCSQPKEFRTGLRIVGSFLKVKLYYNICGTQVPLRLPVARGLKQWGYSEYLIVIPEVARVFNVWGRILGP